MKPLLTLMIVLYTTVATAQDDLIAYMPKKHIERTADSERIMLTSTGEQGVYTIDLPEGTISVDVLNAKGGLAVPQPEVLDGHIDIRQLRASTYTIRAHTIDAIVIRRFALMGEGASLWAIDADPVR